MVDQTTARMDELAIHHARRTFAALHPEHTVRQALDDIRSQRIDSAIVYFYVIDDHSHLLGVVPTRRLLIAAPDTRISALMTDASVTLPLSATVRDAAASLVEHRLLAVPIVGQLGRMHGVIDAVALGAEMSSDVTGTNRAELFQLIGVRMTDGGEHRFQSRFFSLLWNVVGGLIAAFVAGAHEQLMGTVAALALFMPVTLALSESVGMQAVAVALEREFKGRGQSNERTLLGAVAAESRVAFRLALMCAAVVATVALVWQQHWRFGLTVLVAISVAMTVAAALGAVVPRLVHRLRRNPTVAAGPAYLALAELICLME